VTRYTFDGVGNLATLAYPNGITNHWTYDARNRLTDLVWRLNTNNVASFQYQLGDASQRTHLVESLNSQPTPLNQSYDWVYDDLYRLKNETISGGTPTGELGVTVIILPWRVCRDGERNGGGSIRRGDGAILPLSFEIGSGFTKGFKFVLTVLKGSVQRAGVVALGGCTGTGIITVMRVLRAESVWRFNATGVRSAG
jgi:hypothetical protein